MSRKQQGVRGTWKRMKKQNTLSCLQQDIRKTSCYNLILCSFFSSSDEPLERTVAGMQQSWFSTTLETILLYCPSEKNLIIEHMLWDCPEQEPNIFTSLLISACFLWVVSLWHDFTDARLTCRRPLSINVALPQEKKTQQWSWVKVGERK